MKNIGQPYAIRFQPIVNRMDIFVNKIKEQVQIGQGLAIVGNTQTLREHTQNLAAIKWGISEGNHRVLSAMEEQMEGKYVPPVFKAMLLDSVSIRKSKSGALAA